MNAMEEENGEDVNSINSESIPSEYEEYLELERQLRNE
jgi:hypothetical protein